MNHVVTSVPRILCVILGLLVSCNGRQQLDSAANRNGGGFPGTGGTTSMPITNQVIIGGTSALVSTTTKFECGPNISDLEDGTGRICEDSLRRGVWYAISDEFCTISPPLQNPGAPALPELLPTPRGASRMAMHFSIESCDYSTVIDPMLDVWGSGLGLDLNLDTTNNTYGLFDASEYKGLSFWAKGHESDELRVRVSTSDSTLVNYGGTCEYEPCRPFEGNITLTGEWSFYEIRFEDITNSWTHPDPAVWIKELTNLQFLPEEVWFDESLTYEFWIDDVRFF